MDFSFDPILMAGLAALGLTIGSWFGDRRRMQRSDPDRVGFMPWTDLFVWSLLAACVLLGLAARAWLSS